MTDPVLQDTIDVSHNGISYVFKIPSLMEEVQMGLLERNIRRDIERDMLPEHERNTRMITGDPDGLDATTFMLVRTAATFQLLLMNCSDRWPFSSKNGHPVIDFKSWPKDKTGEAIATFLAFQARRNEMFRLGTSDDNAASGEAVASQ